MERAGFWSALKNFVNLITLVSLAVGFIVVARQWRLDSRNEMNARVTSAYERLDDRYIEFQKLCMENPGLDCYDSPLPDAEPPATQDDRIKQRLLYTVAISNFERAYLHFHPHSGKQLSTMKDQWEGWSLYMDNFLRRKAFQEVWLETRCEFDRRFSRFFDDKAEAFGVERTGCPQPKG